MNTAIRGVINKVSRLSRRNVALISLVPLLILSIWLARPADAITLRAASSADNGAGASSPLSIPVPTGTQVGDVLIVNALVKASISSSGLSGGGQSGVELNVAGSGATFSMRTYYYVYPSAQPASLSFSWSCLVSCSGAKVVAGAIAYSGVDTADPVDVYAGQTNSSSTTMTAPSVTTTVPNAMLVAVYGIGLDSSATEGSGMTERFDIFSSGGGSGSSKGTTAGQDVVQPTPGASGTKTMLAANAAENGGRLIALRPAPTVSQAAYRFFQNTDSTTVGAPLAAKNTGITAEEQSQFRLRLNLGVASGGSNLSSVAERTFNLQYGYKDTGGTCVSWGNVTVSSPVRFYGNATPADGAAYAVDAVNDPTRAGITSVEQKYHEINPLSMAANTPANQDALWDVSLIIGANAIPGRTYCLRLVDTNGSALLNGGYTVIPEVTVSPITVTQANYRFFGNADSSVPGAPLAAQDATATLAPETPLRLRQRLAVNGFTMPTSYQNYKLQYAEKSGVCDVGFSGETYIDMVSGSQSFQAYLPNGGTNDTSIGTNAWSVPGNVDATDGFVATATGKSQFGSYTNYLRTSTHSFTVPLNATIVGIQVSGVFTHTNNSGFSSFGVNSARLAKAGSYVGDDKSLAEWYNGMTLGGETDLWGTTWSPAEINDSGFGVGISASIISDGATNEDVYVDSITVTVHYLVPSVSDELAYYDNPTPADGASITSTADDPTNSGRTVQYQRYKETDPYTNDFIGISRGNDGMWDFALTSSAAAAGKTYCIRTVKSDGSPLDSYSQIPEVTFSGGGGGAPTTEQKLRGGQSVRDGVKSPFEL